MTKNGNTHLCQGRQTTRNDFEEAGLGVYYLERSLLLGKVGCYPQTLEI
jgi:hypothetical protein